MRGIPLKWVWDQAGGGLKGESVLVCCVWFCVGDSYLFTVFLFRFVECFLPLTPNFLIAIL